jgi:hypothetical protein
MDTHWESVLRDWNMQVVLTWNLWQMVLFRDIRNSAPEVFLHIQFCSCQIGSRYKSLRWKISNYSRINST